MSINLRIKELRKHLNMNQKEFGEKIGMGQAGVSWIEKDGHTITDANIRLICNNFKISEKWLRTGDGEMFVKSEKNLLSKLSSKYHLTLDEEKLVRNFLTLTDEQRAVFVQAIVSAAKGIGDAPTPPKDFERTKSDAEIEQTNDVDAKRQLVNPELNAEALSDVAGK